MAHKWGNIEKQISNFDDMEFFPKFSPRRQEFVMKTERFLLVAVFTALVFAFFACSSGDDVDGNQPSNGSSALYTCQLPTGCIQATISDCSQIGGSVVAVCQEPSSSSRPPSSGSVAGGYTGSYGSVTHGGKSYKTVVIGTQTWMAENLNYSVTGSVCYNGQESNCGTYGRLYSWATAMDLPSSCNSGSCSGQVQSKHRGICPSGWHIPSDAEWTTLTNYVGSSTAGTKLKATSGWNSRGNGTDTYGFAAIPGGCGASGGGFGYAGDLGTWWSSTEDGALSAYARVMDYDYEGVGGYGYGKYYLFSVRCLQDSAP
jgi:uncharacterized protein (TIGR02145 family)